MLCAWAELRQVCWMRIRLGAGNHVCLELWPVFRTACRGRREAIRQSSSASFARTSMGSGNDSDEDEDDEAKGFPVLFILFSIFFSFVS